jgi:hypothetical protein
MSATVCAHSYGQRAFAAVLRGDDVLAYASHIWSEWPPTLGCNGGAVSAAGAGAARISLRAWCDEGSSCPGSGTSADIALTSFRADITDRFAPVVSDVHESGSTVRFDATDTGVGVFRAVAEARVAQAGAWTELGHALIGSCSPLGETAYRYEFDTPQPCPLHTDAASLAVDEASLPVGTHDLRVVVEDAAGNRTDVLPSHAVVVSAPPVVAKVLVRRPALRLRSAAPFRLRGRILDLASKPIAGARILVESRPFLPKPGLATGQWRSVGHFSTATSGHFSVPLPAGPSRVLRVSYGGTSAESTVIVPAHITAHAHRRRVHNGHTLVISGRVTGPIPEGGVLTTLEVRQAGRWSTVATTRPWVRTGPSGTFTLKYHFRRTFRATTYKFRAAAGDDSAFQYTRGHSHVMSVRVVP